MTESLNPTCPVQAKPYWVFLIDSLKTPWRVKGVVNTEPRSPSPELQRHNLSFPEREGATGRNPQPSLREVEARLCGLMEMNDHETAAVTVTMTGDTAELAATSLYLGRLSRGVFPSVPEGLLLEGPRSTEDWHCHPRPRKPHPLSQHFRGLWVLERERVASSCPGLPPWLGHA